MPTLNNWFFLSENSTVYVTGEISRDSRYNPTTTEFKDGHRIVSSPVTVLGRSGEDYWVETRNTHYDLATQLTDKDEIRRLYIKYHFGGYTVIHQDGLFVPFDGD